jgi:hypothetical protein
VSDPFFELCRHIDLAGTSGWDVVYRSEDVHDELNPVWKEAAIELSFLCGGDFNLPVLVRVFDYEKSGRHVLMGSVETTVNMLLEASQSDDASKGMTLTVRGRETGSLLVSFAELALPEGDSNLNSALRPVVDSPQPSFVDYVNGGCSIKVVIGIDYGASNGHPRSYDSLHYLDPEGTLNDYEKALTSLVGILEIYDDDRKFPVWGFGADFDGNTSNCFHCSGSREAVGVSGVTNAYKSPLRSCDKMTMNESTSYVQIINGASQHALQMSKLAESCGTQAYTILLVLTDGAGVHVGDTVDALKEVIESPLSVIFVGVGESNFEEMQFLNDALRKYGRDMVSFVQFNKYRSHLGALTAATLNEVPAQLVDFFQKKEIAPLPPVQINDEDIQVEEYDESSEIDLTFDIQGGEISASER